MVPGPEDGQVNIPNGTGGCDEGASIRSIWNLWEDCGTVDKCAEECYSVGTFVNHEIAFSSCSRLGLTGWYDYIP